MSDNEIVRLVHELLRNGIHIVPADERHTPERCELLERVLNKLLGVYERQCVVTLDALAVKVTLI